MPRRWCWNEFCREVLGGRTLLQVGQTIVFCRLSCLIELQMSFTRRHLPHWIPEDTIVFVTWRLAGPCRESRRQTTKNDRLSYIRTNSMTEAYLALCGCRIRGLPVSWRTRSFTGIRFAGSTHSMPG